MKEYTTRKHMAEMLNVHPNTLDNLRKRNQGPPCIRVGRVIRYTLGQAFQEWQKSQRQVIFT